MATVLDTIAPLIAAGFKGKLSSGTLRRQVWTATSPNGDPSTPSIETFPFEGIQDNFNAAFAAAAGIPVTDVRVLIIAGLCATDPRQDDQLFIRPVNAVAGNWVQVREILKIDPAVASYELQCFKIPDPTEE